VEHGCEREVKMSKEDRVLVTGATGRVGRAVTQELLKAGEPVRALVRSNEARLDAAVAQTRGDLSDPATLRDAFTGVKRVFLYAQGDRAPDLADVMRRAGVEQVVVLSTIDANSEQPFAQYNRRRHRAYEDAIRDGGFRFTLLRPGAFASNAVRFWAQDVRENQRVRLPFPESQQAPIDERDIGRIAVHALRSTALDGQALVLTGPESLTQRRQVQALAAALNRPLTLVQESVDEARARLGRIIPSAYVELLLAQWQAESSVRAVVTDAVERVTDAPATPFAAWAVRHVELFRGELR
jgi:uncharacterized protein YbjT (DUF2867 family)